MKKAKKLLATFLALAMIFSTVSLFASSVDFRGENSPFYGYDANLGDGNAQSFVYTTEFYKQDTSGNWVPTTTAQPGEDVMARVTLQTDFPTNAQNIIAVWDADVFTDKLTSTSMDANCGEAGLLNTDEGSYAKVQNLAQSSTYSSYRSAAPYWNDLHESYYDADETEHYISDAVYNKYKNSWIQVQTINSNKDMPQGAINPGTEWLFQIPLTVKSAEALGSLTSGSFMIVADAMSSYDNDDTTDYYMAALSGVNNVNPANYEGVGMGYWMENLNLVPHFDLNDATLTIEAATSTAIVMFEKGADDAVLTGIDIFEDEVGSTISVPTVTLTGCTFKGWDSNGDNVADLAATATETTIPETDTTYTAIWEAPLTVNYYIDGTTDKVPGIETNPYTAQVIYNTTYSVTSPVLDNYTLKNQADATVTGTMPAAPKTVNVYYTLNTASLTIKYFIVDTETPVPGIETNPYTANVGYGQTYSVDSPAVPGYTANPATVSGTMGNTGVVETVYYTPNPHTITYRITDEEGNISDYVNPGNPQNINFGGQVVLLDKPAKEYYTYTDWSLGNGEIPETMPDEDLVLYSTETPVRGTVIVVDRDGVALTAEPLTFKFDGESVTVGDLAEYVDALEFDYGYEFGGWGVIAAENVPDEWPAAPDFELANHAIDNSAAGNASNTWICYPLQNPQDVTVRWIPDEAKFDEDDPSTYESETVPFGEAITYREAPAKEFYTFAGWYCDSDELDDLSNLRTAQNWDETVTMSEEEDSGMYYFAYYTPKNYDLVVNYVMSDNTEAPESYKSLVEDGNGVAYNTSYEVQIPIVPGYHTADNEAIVDGVLRGTMDAAGKTITVTYEPNEYTLTVTFTMSDNSQAPEDHTEQVAYNAQYSYTPDAITGYTASPAVVEGTMNNVNGKTEEVVYTANKYDLVINYKYADGGEAAPSYKSLVAAGEGVAYNSTYNVQSPVISGYKPTIDNQVVDYVTGTMDSVEGKTIDVIYKAEGKPLTIHYKYADGTKAHDDFVGDVDFGGEYSVESPVIEGYTPNLAVVSGTMNSLTGLELTVEYAINSHNLTIHYVYADNTQAAEDHTETVEYNTAYSVESPAITGYTPDPATVTGTMGDADAVVTVTYRPKAHTVTWILDGGSINNSTDNIVQDVVFNDAITAPGTPVKAGFAFAGWTPQVAATVADQDYIYTATWEATSYEVHYNVKNLETDTTETVTRYLGYGDEIPTSVYTAPEGYAFHGWFTDYDATTGEYSNGLSTGATMPAETLELYGYISVKGYAVTFDLAGGNIGGDAGPIENNVAFMNTIVAPDDPVREGYTFKGWSPLLADGEVLDTPAARTYTATWEAKEYTITYYASADDHEAETVYEQNTYVAGAAVEPVADPVKEGQTFSKWLYYKAEDESTIENFDGTMPAYDVCAIAVYNTYHLYITYTMQDGNNAVKPDNYSATVEANDEYNVPSPPVTGYTPNIEVVEGTMPAEDVAVEVIYTPIKYALTISYVDGEGNLLDTGADNPYTAQVDYNKEYSVASPAITNMHLVNETQATISGTMPAEAVTVEVAYAMDEYTLTISYVDGEGNLLDTGADNPYTAQVAVGADYSQASPVVEGYKLAVPEQATISGTMPAENVTVTVNYVASAGLTINYVIKGTSTPVAPSYIDENLYEGDPYTVDSPTVEHYHLVDDLQATISGTMPAGQVTITVEYELDEITITWTDIEGTHELKGAYGTDVEEPTPAEDTHNIFTGWLKDGSPAEFPTTFTENATYTANYDVVYPKLIARNPDKTTVDRDRHIVYGFADEDGDVALTLTKITDVFLDVEGDGTMQVTPAYTYNDKGLYGTGAVVTVIDNATGLPVEGETFTVVVFGDINGDGRVTSADTTAVRNEAATVTTWSIEKLPDENNPDVTVDNPDYNYIKLLAGDVNHDGKITSNADATAIRKHVACVTFIEQHPESL